MEPSLRPTVVERLDPEPVAGGEQALLDPIPDHEGKHALQSGQAVLAPLAISLDQGFGVTTAAPAPGRLQLLAQQQVIVDFAIECNDIALIRRQHGLMPGRRQVEDGQAPLSQADLRVMPNALVIRTATHQPPQRRFEALLLRRFASGTVATRDSAHASPVYTVVLYAIVNGC